MKEIRTVYTCDVCEKESEGKRLPRGWFRVACGDDLGGYTKLHLCGTGCLIALAEQFRNGEKPGERNGEEAA